MLAPREQVLFNPGPVNLDPRVYESITRVELCHRQPEFEALQERVRARLVAHFGDGPSTRLSLMHGSGSLAVDAALATFVRGRVLVVDNGLYCQRLVRTLAALGVDADVVGGGPGQRVDLGAVAGALARGYDWVATVHHETTTGILNPASELADLARDGGARLFLDAVSSLGVHEVDRRADVICFNSAKCLESLLGVAAVLWRGDLPAHPTVPILDVTAYAAGTPTTPHVQALVALDTALDLYDAEDRPARYRRLAGAVWRLGSARFEPLLPEADRSWVLTSFRLGGRDPDDLFARALARGYVIYHGQQALRSEIFRVANMGAKMSEAVIADLFEVLDS